MFFFYIGILLMSVFWSAESTYSIKKISTPLGVLLETPNWSIEENALYFVDFAGQQFFRLDGETGVIRKKYVSCGTVGLIMPLKSSPNYVLLGVKSSIYVVNFNAPDIEKALRLYTTVDIGRPGNVVHDAKVDAKGRLWFGTVGTVTGTTIDSIIPDQASLYVITNETYTRTCPRVARRPVTLSDGIVWSLDYKKMYYNDSPTRKILVYDYDLETGEISNATTFLDFDVRDIAGFPNGMTIDSDGHLWVATFDGKKVLRINSSTGKIMLRIKLPVDLVTSLMWGGENLATLYVTTGKLNKLTLDSGALFAVEVDGCRGVPQNYMEINNVQNY